MKLASGLLLPLLDSRSLLLREFFRRFGGLGIAVAVRSYRIFGARIGFGWFTPALTQYLPCLRYHVVQGIGIGGSLGLRLRLGLRLALSFAALAGSGSSLGWRGANVCTPLA